MPDPTQGQAGPHGLDQRQGAVLVDRGKHEAVGPGEQGGHVGAVAGEFHQVVDAIPGDLSLALESFVTVADKQQPEAVAVPDNAREGVDRDAGRLGRRTCPPR